MSAQTYQVIVEHYGMDFEARGDETLLEASIRALTPLDSSCRSGTCRTCMCKLESGQVEYDMEWPGLSPEEKKAGWVLPCVARPLSDVVLSGG